MSALARCTCCRWRGHSPRDMVIRHAPAVVVMYRRRCPACGAATRTAPHDDQRPGGAA